MTLISNHPVNQIHVKAIKVNKKKKSYPTFKPALRHKIVRASYGKGLSFILVWMTFHFFFINIQNFTEKSIGSNGL